MKGKTLKIKELLQNGESITPQDAVNKFKLYRLGSIIFHLRKHYDLDIITINEKAEDGTAYARYILNEFYKGE